MSLKELILNYGKLALGVHISLSVVSYGLCYVLVKNGLINNERLQKYFSSIKKDQQPNQPQNQQQEQQQIENEVPKQTNEQGPQQEQQQNQVQQEGQQDQKQNGNQFMKKAGTYGVAYLIYKALMPIRLTLTISIVGILAKLKK